MIYANALWHSDEWAGVSLFCTECNQYLDYDQEDEESVPLVDLVAVAKAHDFDTHGHLADPSESDDTGPV